jgi:RNA polymerase sigma-70 factor (ECF subfamily)
MSEREARLQAFEREALAHLDAMLRTAGRVTGSGLDAEDVVQETFLRAWRYFDTFEAGTNCRAWLFQIMFDLIKSRRRDLARRPETPLEDEMDDAFQPGNIIVFDPARRIEGSEVLEAAGLLSEEHRTVLFLIAVEEFTYREAAEILGVPVGTVMSRLHRARHELRRLLMTNRSGVRFFNQ